MGILSHDILFGIVHWIVAHVVGSGGVLVLTWSSSVFWMTVLFVVRRIDDCE